MVILREATAADAGLISRIIAATWREAYQGLIDDAYLARLPEEYWLPSLRTWLDSGRMYGFIAEADGFPVGAVIYGRGRDSGFVDWGEIASLYVLPEASGRGIGSSLLAAAMQALREEGYTRFYLWAIEGNHRADRFYRSRGFSVTQDREHYRIGGRAVTDLRYAWEE